MSGGKGGSQTSKVEIPAWLEDPSKRAINRGEQIGKIGYVPYMGPDIAAMSGQQMAGIDNTNQMAQAFGMASSPSTLPQAQDFGNGVSGYASAPLFQGAQDAMPGKQRHQIDALFNDYGMSSPTDWKAGLTNTVQNGIKGSSGGGKGGAI